MDMPLPTDSDLEILSQASSEQSAHTSIQSLQGMIENLASKRDLESLLSTIVDKFKCEMQITFETLQTEIRSRDQTIDTMQLEVNELKEATLEQHLEINRLSSRLENLEQGYVTSIRTDDSNFVGESLADETHNNLDDESVDIEPEPRKEVVDFALCGDSLIKWVPTEEIISAGNNKRVCLKGAKIKKIRQAVLNLHEEYDIKSLAIHGGSNSVPEDTPIQIAYEIIDFLSELKMLMPSTDIYFSAILPKIDDSFTPGMNEINQLVYSACAILGITFVQHRRFSNRGCMNDSLYTHSDLIHLNRRGVKQFTYDIKSSLA